MLALTFTKSLSNFHLSASFSSDKGILGILGSSGSGKSLTLKCIAGLFTPETGKISLNGKDLFNADKGINIPPRKRNIGYVFQNYALFPHLTVNQNIAYGLHQQEKGIRQQKVSDMIAKMQLSGLQNRFPSQLSGGQQQRVALARTLITEPELLLLDEPFSALDSHIKRLMQKELLGLIRTNYDGIVLLVTHNIEEAYRLSDRIAIFDQGKTLQIGDKEEIIASPANLSAARITGCNNFLEVEKVAEEDDFHVFRSKDLVFKVQKKALLDSSQMIAGVRANDLQIEPAFPYETNCFACDVLEKIDGVFATTIIVNCLGNHFRVEVSKHAWPHLSACSCKKMMLNIPSDKVFLLPREE